MNDTDALAGRWRRLCATLIDAMLVPALTLLLVMATGIVEDAEDYRTNLWMLWVLLQAILSYLLLNGYLLWRHGQTIGKRLLGIAIVPADALGPNPTAAAPAPLWKLVCLRAPFFPLLFLIVVPWLALLPLIDQLPIFTRQRRCLHDWVAGTVVISARDGKSVHS